MGTNSWNEQDLPEIPIYCCTWLIGRVAHNGGNNCGISEWCLIQPATLQGGLWTIGLLDNDLALPFPTSDALAYYWFKFCHSGAAQIPGSRYRQNCIVSSLPTLCADH